MLQSGAYSFPRVRCRGTRPPRVHQILQARSTVGLNVTLEWRWGLLWHGIYIRHLENMLIFLNVVVLNRFPRKTMLLNILYYSRTSGKHEHISQTVLNRFRQICLPLAPQIILCFANGMWCAGRWCTVVGLTILTRWDDIMPILSDSLLRICVLDVRWLWLVCH